MLCLDMLCSMDQSYCFVYSCFLGEYLCNLVVSDMPFSFHHGMDVLTITFCALEYRYCFAGSLAVSFRKTAAAEHHPLFSDITAI
jgi:hypothetical protein